MEKKEVMNYCSNDKLSICSVFHGLYVIYFGIDMLKRDLFVIDMLLTK